MNDSTLEANALADSPTPATPHVVRRIVAWVAQMALAGCGVAYLAGAGARWHWALDLFTHFTLQLVMVAATVVMVLAGLRQWKACLWAALLLTALLWRALPGSAQIAPWADDRQSPVLKVIVANIWGHSDSFERLTRFVENESPDVVVLQELTADNLGQLEPTLTSYPHRHVVVRDDAFGMGVFSQRELMDLEVKYWSAQLPSLMCRLPWNGAEVCLIATHPLPPMRRDQSQLRNQQLARLALEAGRRTQPLVVLGDLNCTPWSPHFRDLLRVGKLRDTRGWQLYATWPAALPWPARIPIDHVLVSHHWSVSKRTLGPRYQSDHLPVSVTLTLNADPGATHDGDSR